MILLSDKDLKNLQKEIESTFSSFTEKLHSKIPQLTNEDYLCCCLEAFGIDHYGMSILLNIEIETAKKRYHRMRKRAHWLNTDQTLDSILIDL